MLPKILFSTSSYLARIWRLMFNLCKTRMNKQKIMQCCSFRFSIRKGLLNLSPSLPLWLIIIHSGSNGTPCQNELNYYSLQWNGRQYRYQSNLPLTDPTALAALSPLCLDATSRTPHRLLLNYKFSQTCELLKRFGHPLFVLLAQHPRDRWEETGLCIFPAWCKICILFCEDHEFFSRRAPDTFNYYFFTLFQQLSTIVLHFFYIKEHLSI